MFAPPEIRKLGVNMLYGHGYKSWIIYHRIALRLPYERLTDALNEQFNEDFSSKSVGGIIKAMALFYKETESRIIANMLKKPCIHVDEMPVSIRGENQYIWVFTDGKNVVFKLTSTRDSDIVHEFLGNYNGVLVSDFYAGYDSVKCRQQKCWVHLIRNMNDDLWGAPFDKEFENFVSAVRSMFVPIMLSVQKYGLKKRNLNKHKKQTDKFYKKFIENARYKSEIAEKYQKRFLRYRESLFVFLSYNDIPWHNNVAERAIRHLAKQKAISGSFGEKTMPNYLVLLGIRQTCRFQGKSFFRFLFSGETDVESFEARTHKRRSK